MFEEGAWEMSNSGFNWAPGESTWQTHGPPVSDGAWQYARAVRWRGSRENVREQPAPATFSQADLPSPQAGGCLVRELVPFTDLRRADNIRCQTLSITWHFLTPLSHSSFSIHIYFPPPTPDPPSHRLAMPLEHLMWFAVFVLGSWVMFVSSWDLCSYLLRHTVG